MPGTDFQVSDVGVGMNAAGFDQPPVDGRGDVSARRIDTTGDIGCREAAGGGRSVRTFLGVISPLDDVAADAG